MAVYRRFNLRKLSMARSRSKILRTSNADHETLWPCRDKAGLYTAHQACGCHYTVECIITVYRPLQLLSAACLPTARHSPETQYCSSKADIKMPQSAEFWTWAKQMREHETDAPEDDRVYLCILYLENKPHEEDRQVSRVAESLEIDLSDDMIRKSPSFSRILDDDLDNDLDSESMDHDPRRRSPLANTPACLVRKGIRFTMPDIVRKWHEIGTVNRHWAIEVRGQVYELYRTRFVSKFRRRFVSQIPCIRDRLTSRLYVGRTHIVDDVLSEIGQ
jgi:hypothetical protein